MLGEEIQQHTDGDADQGQMNEGHEQVVVLTQRHTAGLGENILNGVVEFTEPSVNGKIDVHLDLQMAPKITRLPKMLHFAQDFCLRIET